MTRFFLLLALTALHIASAAEIKNPDRVSVASAANLVYALDALDAAFAKTSPATYAIVF